MFRATVLTLFPDVVAAYLGESILGRAQSKGLLQLSARDLRSYAEGKHKVTDDAPYGGGAGMVMKVEPITAAVEALKAESPDAYVLLMSPRGKRFEQADAKRLVGLHRPLVFICGRYEGVDERVLPLVDEELSVGDFVLTGGELAAMCIVDAVARLSPGVLGNETSSHAESFEEGLLEYPQYTRPPSFRGMEVPQVLQSGDHARIARWRRYQALALTRERRPDLFARLALSEADQKLLSRDPKDL